MNQQNTPFALSTLFTIADHTTVKSGASRQLAKKTFIRYPDPAALCPMSRGWHTLVVLTLHFKVVSFAVKLVSW